MTQSPTLEQWRRFTQGLFLSDSIPEIILSSWCRSRDAGVPALREALACRRADDDEIERRRLAVGDVLAIADRHLDQLDILLRDVLHFVSIVDRDGIVVAARGPGTLLQKFNLLPGFDWSESAMGTNGAGTALAIDAPVAVVGPEHFCAAWHDCACAAAPLHAPDGSLIGAIDVSTAANEYDPNRLALVSYIASMIDTELGLRAREREAQNRIATLTKTARQIEETLREADRRKDEFLAVLSHELRNPLAPIRSSVDVLERAAPGSEQARRAQAVIGRQVSHLTRLIDDLLDVTRIGRGKMQLQRERLELAELVRRTTEDHRTAFVAHRVSLDLAVADMPLWVNADATRIAQVLGNLLQNAVKFTAPGGRVEVSLEASNGDAMVCVRDTGIGISADMLGTIFEPFAQADNTLVHSRGGLGIGLALVKGLIGLHGGSVSVASDGEDRGATFMVRLPLESAPAARAVPGIPAERPLHRRVLVVEDNVDAANGLQELLTLDGHDVAVAYSGAEGLRKARKMRPDIVLCDIGLPDMDGYAVARAFRCEAELGGAFLVALTGYALPGDLQKAAEAGFDLHLAKPPNMETLQHVLRQATHRTQASDAATDATTACGQLRAG